MVRTGRVDIAEPAEGVYGVVEVKTTAFYRVRHGESEPMRVSFGTILSESSVLTFVMECSLNPREST